MKNNKQRILIISGPTGVGKSDLACSLALMSNGEIINADMGQMYTPFSIGTAKPDFSSCATVHHLFNIINEPRDYTVIEYRIQASLLIDKLTHSNKLPLVVGGSVFYIQSLLFPPTAACSQSNQDENDTERTKDISWAMLHEIDPERAAHIHPNDMYRIRRAMSIWTLTGQKPSCFVRDYNPLASGILLWVTRDRDDLYERINNRVITMIEQGWINECQQLLDTPWQTFINKKKLIGYNEIFNYLQGNMSLAQAIATIQQRTRAYAKRQETFWHMLKKQISSAQNTTQSMLTDTINLTHQDPALYSKKLLDKLYKI